MKYQYELTPEETGRILDFFDKAMASSVALIERSLALREKIAENESKRIEIESMRLRNEAESYERYADKIGAGKVKEFPGSKKYGWGREPDFYSKGFDEKCCDESTEGTEDDE